MCLRRSVGLYCALKLVRDCAEQGIGPSLETSVEQAGRCVQGDPKTDNRPVMPPKLERDNNPLMLHETRMVTSKIEHQWGEYSPDGTTLVVLK